MCSKDGTGVYTEEGLIYSKKDFKQIYNQAI